MISKRVEELAIQFRRETMTLIDGDDKFPREAVPLVAAGISLVLGLFVNVARIADAAEERNATRAS